MTYSDTLREACKIQRELTRYSILCLLLAGSSTPELNNGEIGNETMTVAHLTSVCLDLVVFLTSLMNFQGAIGYADPEVVVVLYIISKLLPRFQELTDAPPPI